jgi:hypothetical protein
LRSDILKVKIESDHRIIFKAYTPINDENKIKELLKVLKSKGVSLPNSDEELSWW